MIKKILVTGALAASLTGGSFWAVKNNKTVFPLPIYTVKEIVDGDSFVTSENQVIRLASIDAPETGLCGGPEAKAQLTKLVKGKPIYLKVLFNDQFKRLVSDVYTINGSVNEAMLASGWAYQASRIGKKTETAARAGESARAKKIGVYGQCVEEVNPKNPDCAIKAQHSNFGAGNVYRFPGCGQYDSTLIQTYLGDQWFCTEAEAQKAGFTKGKDCFNQKYQ